MNDLPERDGLRVGDVAVVTGGAAGLGAAYAKAMAAEGAKVVIADVGDGSPVVGIIEQAGGTITLQIEEEQAEIVQ